MDYDFGSADLPIGDEDVGLEGFNNQQLAVVGATGGGQSVDEGSDMGDRDGDDDGNTGGPGGGPVIGSVPQRLPREVIPATPFAGVYRSLFTLNHPTNGNLHLLQHVNCSYLSTPGHAPTITQLKQHAQSLVILIKQLTISTLAAPIDNANLGVPPIIKFNDGESYDFLNDLRKPYTGPEDDALRLHHNMPLPNVLNLLEEEHIEARHGKAARPARVKIWDMCPLHHSEATPVNQKSLPYATHQTLISHANECLELLDHEYSAKGGLLAILPKKEEKEDREAAESTILGQLILYVQRLVQRVHDLERCYANAMDVIAGEAVVPHQALSRMGPDGRQGREMVYPQDRFVLVNAGNDLYSYMNDEFDRRERVDEAVMANYKRMGLTGEALWQNRGGREYSRGIVALDINTRYYRLKNDPLKTIFVIPAHAQHPNTKVTRDMESQPTVVSVVKPIWPERQSTWELKNRADLDAFKKLKAEHATGLADLENYKDTQAVLELSLELAQGEARKWKQKYEETVELLGGDDRDNAHDVLMQVKETEKLREDLEAAKAAVQRERDQVEQERTVARNAKTKMISAERDHQLNLKAKVETHDRWLGEEKSKITAQTAEAGKIATEVADRLRNAWLKQIRETAIINTHLNHLREELRKEFLKLDINIDARLNEPANQVPDDTAERIGLRWGDEIGQVARGASSQGRILGEANGKSSAILSFRPRISCTLPSQRAS